MRAPRQPKSLPKPLTADDARRVVSADGQMAEEPWIAARNAAVLTLLYGCGLRISEALGLSGDALSDPSARSMTITGKGSKTRLVPLLPAVHKAVAQYRALCPFDLSAGQPLFRGAKGGPLHAAIIQREMQKLRAGLGLPDSATPMPCATFCNASSGARRRFAHHSGASGSCKPVHHTGLYRRRYAAIAGSLRQDASPRLKFTKFGCRAPVKPGYSRAMKSFFSSSFAWRFWRPPPRGPGRHPAQATAST